MLLSALACIRFRPDDGPPLYKCPEDRILIETQPNGLCFWTCLFLGAVASSSQLLGFYNTPRLPNGMPSGDAAEKETDDIREWALSLDNPPGRMPRQCRRRIIKGESAVIPDIEPCRFSKIPLSLCVQCSRIFSTCCCHVDCSQHCCRSGRLRPSTSR